MTGVTREAKRNQLIWIVELCVVFGLIAFKAIDVMNRQRPFLINVGGSALAVVVGHGKWLRAHAAFLARIVVALSNRLAYPAPPSATPAFGADGGVTLPIPVIRPRGFAPTLIEVLRPTIQRAVLPYLGFCSRRRRELPLAVDANGLLAQIADDSLGSGRLYDPAALLAGPIAGQHLRAEPLLVCPDRNAALATESRTGALHVWIVGLAAVFASIHTAIIACIKIPVNT